MACGNGGIIISLVCIWYSNNCLCVLPSVEDANSCSLIMRRKSVLGGNRKYVTQIVRFLCLKLLESHFFVLNIINIGR
ncbi:ORF941 [White spot syndrome virus]|uniref:ORF941 n=1 Tax=White spot syndrome virus TaxID=342409 RepID=A0A2D3I672_9VIRU|nr:ORF941 [White spot syndrome virus]